MKLSKNILEKWLPHLAGLLLFIILPLFVFEGDNEKELYWTYSYYFQFTFMIVAFYVNYLIIVPHFFFRKNKSYFFIILILFGTILLILTQYFFEIHLLDKMRPLSNPVEVIKPPKSTLLHPKLVDNFFLLLLVLGFSSGMAIIHQFRKNEAKQKEIENASVESELAFLKNQISPHFFFNSLNNIYALIAIDGDKAQKAVEKLSGLMRYLIYDSDIKTVELKKEFEFMQNYIDLMQQRLTSKVKLTVNIQKEPTAVQVPPLIFIPFVENAFKHGISYRSESFINISLKTEGDRLRFECINSVAHNTSEYPKEKGGLGIVNIKRRLKLLYGANAQLIQVEENDIYTIKLEVPLNVKLIND